MMMPLKQVQNVAIAHPNLTMVGSRSKYSAKPPHTPAIFLLGDNVNFLFIIVLINAARLGAFRSKHAMG